MKVYRVICAAALLCLALPAANAQGINVLVNGQSVPFSGPQPRMIAGRVMVPLRGVLEDIGATVNWQPSTQTVVAYGRDKEIDLPIGSHTATVNGQPVNLDVPALVVDGRTMVPLRFVSEALGAQVGWSEYNQTVSIDTNYPARAAGGHNFMTRPGVPGARAAGVVGAGAAAGYAGRRIAAHRAARVYTIPRGTVIPVTLDEGLNSDQSHEGDQFSATVVNGPEASDLPEGTKFEGVVSEAIPARNGRPGVLAVRFRDVVFPNGDTRPVDASVISLDTKSVTRTGSGRIVAKSPNRSNETLKWVGIGAGAGLLLSTVAKGNTLLDTLLGGGAGYLYDQLRNKGANNVNLDAGSRIGVELRRQFAFDRADIRNQPDNYQYDNGQ